MKNKILKFILMLIIGLSTHFGAKAQDVRDRPHGHEHEMEHRPDRPSPRHYWRDGEWEWRGGAYVWAPGLWIIPPSGTIWVGGHWRRTHHGWRWAPGHWR